MIHSEQPTRGGGGVSPRRSRSTHRHEEERRVWKGKGIEAGRRLLGDGSEIVTEMYAEVDRTKARKIVAKIG